MASIGFGTTGANAMLALVFRFLVAILAVVFYYAKWSFFQFFRYAQL